MKAIPGELQHALVIADIGKMKIRKVVRMTKAERRKVTLLKDVKIRKREGCKRSIMLTEKKLDMCFVDLEKDFVIVPVGWAMRKN